jgi:Protein of unknown function (DUF2530)
VEHELKHAPPPLQVDTVRVVIAGTVVWGVALVVLLFLGDRVDPLWTYTCLAAIALAALGLGVMRLQGQLPRRRRSVREDVEVGGVVPR